jgi:CO dehydrogenase maturation factor
MKICVCGKGGSGKSTVVSVLAHALRRKSKDVIVLDSDESNTSLFWMLGFKEPPKPLMDFVGGKKQVQKKMSARFSKGEKEPMMPVLEMEKITSASIPSEYIVSKDGIRMMTTGKIHNASEGCACPMGAVTREFLKKFYPEENEVLLVDTEAGIEHFGRGVEAGADCVISVVEPSLESIQLAKKTMDLSVSSGAVFRGAILNKISSEDQKRQITKRLNELCVPIIGVIEFQAAIQSACLEEKKVDYVMDQDIIKALSEELA